jgi:hypothetical protein
VNSTAEEMSTKNLKKYITTRCRYISIELNWTAIERGQFIIIIDAAIF